MTETINTDILTGNDQVVHHQDLIEKLKDEKSAKATKIRGNNESILPEMFNCVAGAVQSMMPESAMRALRPLVPFYKAFELAVKGIIKAASNAEARQDIQSIDESIASLSLRHRGADQADGPTGMR